ncbi:MAG: hypothetical protein HQM09_17735 [Candidatus Riflebacteria bacterium]|nr:hypothetical protein [Candidatus Riflebacteria bacterium]
MFGPVIDLAPNVDGYQLGLDHYLNHGPATGSSIYRLPKSMLPASYATEVVYSQVFDEDGLRVIAGIPSLATGAPRLLFLGDSFMQGFDDDHTISEIVRRKLLQQGLTFSALNGGFSSYSPIIFIAQARKLLPKIRPKCILVDIDPTDLYDDNIRYRNLANRDMNGHIYSVTPSGPARKSYLTYLSLNENILYITRLVRKAIFLKAVYHQYNEGYTDGASGNIIDYTSFLSATAPVVVFPDHIAFFEKNLHELAGLCKEFVGEQNILFVTHPHLRHFPKYKQNAKIFNTIIADIVGKVAREEKICFFDASMDLFTAFGENPEQYFFRYDIHYNLEGIQIYSNIIASAVYTAFAPVLRTADPGHQ